MILFVFHYAMSVNIYKFQHKNELININFCVLIVGNLWIHVKFNKLFICCCLFIYINKKILVINYFGTIFVSLVCFFLSFNAVYSNEHVV